MQTAMKQPDLFGQTTVMKAANDNVRDSVHWQKAAEFHAKNPQVYDLVEQFTQQVIDAGHQHYGMQTILERIRWHVMVETSDDTFKINNNYGAFYARLYMENHPEHEGFFRTRTSKRQQENGAW